MCQLNTYSPSHHTLYEEDDNSNYPVNFKPHMESFKKYIPGIVVTPASSETIPNQCFYPIVNIPVSTNSNQSVKKTDWNSCIPCKCAKSAIETILSILLHSEKLITSLLSKSSLFFSPPSYDNSNTITRTQHFQTDDLYRFNGDTLKELGVEPNKQLLSQSYLPIPFFSSQCYQTCHPTTLTSPAYEKRVPINEFMSTRYATLQHSTRQHGNSHQTTGCQYTVPQPYHNSCSVMGVQIKRSAIVNIEQDLLLANQIVPQDINGCPIPENSVPNPSWNLTYFFSKHETMKKSSTFANHKQRILEELNNIDDSNGPQSIIISEANQSLRSALKSQQGVNKTSKNVVKKVLFAASK